MHSDRDITLVLKLLGDQTRLRILSVLQGNELTVKELTEVLRIGQSTLSTQLGQLKEANLVSFRKENQFVYYRLSQTFDDEFTRRICDEVLQQAQAYEWHERDQRRLLDIFERRREASLSFFASREAQNQVSPGQTWEALGRGLIELISELDVVDLGCGVGRLSAMLAASGNRVTGIDNSDEQISGAQSLHAGLALPNLSFKKAPMEATGLAANSWDLVVVSHALHHAAQPRAVIQEAWRLLKDGGRLLILDLHAHNQEWIKERFADFWLGFDQNDLIDWLGQCGFLDVRCHIAGSDPAWPEIEPLVLIGRKQA